jgi:hypothetical protein
MFKTFFLRPRAFLKWLATAEQLPTSASTPEPIDPGRKRRFLKQLLGRERLPVWDPVPVPHRDRPSFIRHLFSRESLPNLSGKGPGAVDDRNSRASRQKESQ